LPLPGLKHWRLERGLSQAQLAQRADLTPDYLFKVESGRRRCNPEASRRPADLLEVDLGDLRRGYDASEAESPPAPGLANGTCTRPT
jgi:transcriptional regulator with XRE-family HTH domain